MPENTVSTGNTVRPTGSISHPSDRVLGPIDRMADALASPDWQPTRAQVAQLIDMAERSGYDRGVSAAAEKTIANIAADYAAAQGCAQLAARLDRMTRDRAKYDAWAAVPHRRDHTGGPVAVWE
jgi:hypothetical protein